MANKDPSYTKDKNGNWVVVPPEIKQKAKDMYFSNATHAVIARSLGVARATITTWINKGWKEEREIKRIEDLNDFFMSKKHEYVDISAKIINSLAGYANYLSTKQEPLTEKEAKTAVEILDKLDKQTRLDENNPTEITQNEKPITIVELKEKLKLDPFNDIEEIEYEENTTLDNDIEHSENPSDHS